MEEEQHKEKKKYQTTVINRNKIKEQIKGYKVTYFGKVNI